MTLVYETIIGEDLDLGVGATTKTDPGGGLLPGTRISLATFAISGVASQGDTSSWTPGAVPAVQSVSITVTVIGALLGDFAMASLNISLGGLILSAAVDGNDSVVVTLSNPTTLTITLGAAILKVLVFRTP